MSVLHSIIEAYLEGPRVLRQAVAGMNREQLLARPLTGKWSTLEVVAHLADFDPILADRIKRVIAEDNPILIGFDQDKWAANLDYKKRKISQPIETFRRLRGENYELLKDQPESTFARTGNHNKRGQMTILDMLRLHTEHVEKHVQHIQAARAAYKEHRAKQAATPTV